jgi:hypothetical protein
MAMSFSNLLHGAPVRTSDFALWDWIVFVFQGAFFFGILVAVP